jgi:hypothetical protein
MTLPPREAPSALGSLRGGLGLEAATPKPLAAARGQRPVHPPRPRLLRQNPGACAAGRGG